MIDLAIYLEASDSTRNIQRSYSITAGQDLFGAWFVATNYGRIGSRGRTKVIMLPDEAETRRYVRQCLKRRERAPQRIGISYTIKDFSGNWIEFSELPAPGSSRRTLPPPNNGYAHVSYQPSV